MFKLTKWVYYEKRCLMFGLNGAPFSFFFYLYYDVQLNLSKAATKKQTK